MEIDFHRLQTFLDRKDKKQPYYRPSTSQPYHRGHNFSSIDPPPQQSLLKRPEKIGCTVRFHQRKTHRSVHSASLYDPLFLQKKILKATIGTEAATKKLIFRKTRQPSQGSQSFHFKDILTDKLKSWNRVQGENNPKPMTYQKKQLRVVKGKMSTYKLKTKGPLTNHNNNEQDGDNSIGVSVIGTKIL